jgi:hypothetical protein
MNSLALTAQSMSLSERPKIANTGAARPVRRTRPSRTPTSPPTSAPKGSTVSAAELQSTAPLPAIQSIPVTTQKIVDLELPAVNDDFYDPNLKYRLQKIPRGLSGKVCTHAEFNS